MEEIQYLGEHLLPGRIGHFAVIAAFCTAALAAFAYFMATKLRSVEEDARSWKMIGRVAYSIHGIAIYGIIGILFYLMLNEYYEYQYVQAHVSDELPGRYIFSAFWEGQEGSFLLWMFWHVTLGFVLMLTARKWESPTLSVLSLVQALLVSMILGLYIGEAKIGTNPLMLLRDAIDAPIFASADYLSKIRGNGLNPLLQNYWMTIHPPTLFLGFASTTIPFTFAVAGLWTGQHKEWLNPALPWALFSGAILGTGILMGGAWAYEALSFGGYWAWDPVENMSLVPWLTLIAGIHTNLVARTTGHAIRSSYIYYMITFLLILYSTFLTRSGVLGETSVHAFTEMGLEWQLVGLMGVFLLVSSGLLIWRYRKIPNPAKEEGLASKEFWMFIGSLVLLFSAIIITASTSLPVFNKIMEYFNPGFIPKTITDPVPHYNKYQLWIAIFIGILSGFAQYLRFREMNWKKQARKFGTIIGITGGLSILLSWVISQWVPTFNWQYSLLLFAGVFTVVSNTDFLIRFIGTNLKASGSALSHIGFGLMIVGIIASGLNKRIISSSPFVMEGLLTNMEDDEGWRKNLLLFKNNPVIMEDYELTYQSDTLINYDRTYTINFKRKDESGTAIEDFEIHPMVQYNKEYNKIAASNPSTKRYFDRDIFTYISGLPEVEMNFELRRQREDSLNYRPFAASFEQPLTVIDTNYLEDRDTFQLRRYSILPIEINRKPVHPNYEPEPGDIAVSAKMMIRRNDRDSVYTVEPALVLRGQLLYSYPEQIDDLNAKIRLNEAVFEEFFTAESDLNYQEFELQKGQEFEVDGYKMQFAGFNNRPEHPDYIAEEEDIAVSAMISIQSPEGKSFMAQPVFFIRGNRPFNIKAEIPSEGLHFRFVKLTPADNSATIMAAHAAPQAQQLPFELATDSYAANWIVLQAIEFPGINLFWFGSSLMMIGLLVSMFRRLRQKPSMA